MGGSSLGPASEAGVLFLRPREAKLSRNSWPTSADTGTACSTTSGFAPAGRRSTEKEFVRKPVNKIHQVWRPRRHNRNHLPDKKLGSYRGAWCTSGPSYVSPSGRDPDRSRPGSAGWGRKRLAPPCGSGGSSATQKKQVSRKKMNHRYSGTSSSGDPEVLLGSEEDCCGCKEAAHTFR